VLPRTLIKYATRPATCGVAIDVPEIVFVAVELPIQALVMLWPGAWISTTEPKLLKLAFVSAIVVAPTVMADGARAGETFAAFWFSLPAATVTWTPARVS
jgi:hypothetical protein